MQPYNSDSLILAVDSHHGIYSPQFAVEQYQTNFTNFSKLSEQIATVEAGPEMPDYWECWEEIEQKAQVLINGIIYNFFSNEDIWLIPEDMEQPELI